MSESQQIKQRVTPHFSLVLDGEDGTPARTWRLCPTYKAIAKIEEAIGLDIKKYDAWKDLSSGKHFPTIVWGLLDKFNPEVTLAEVVEVLNPEAQQLLSNEIFLLMFPGAREAIERLKETGATESPNVQTVTTA
jgi:hypothetical protein